MKKSVLAILSFYKNYISPYTIRSCRFVPTCSEYAAEAVNEFGVFRGLLKAFFRILRCNPFSRGGYDPVPKNN